MNEQKFDPKAGEEKSSFEQAFRQLREILDILEENGFTVPEYCYSPKKIKQNWQEKNPFPIARDGLDGIRAKLMPNGKFRVFFTNGFEDPEDPKRVEITKILKEKGFDVV